MLQWLPLVLQSPVGACFLALHQCLGPPSDAAHSLCSSVAPCVTNKKLSLLNKLLRRFLLLPCIGHADWHSSLQSKCLIELENVYGQHFVC